MVHIIYPILAFLAGVVVGFIFYYGLWLTVRFLPRSRSPVLVVMVSFVVRTALVLVTLYYMILIHWSCMVAYVIGFLMMRIVLIQRIGKGSTIHPEQTKEATVNGNNS